LSEFNSNEYGAGKLKALLDSNSKRILAFLDERPAHGKQGKFLKLFLNNS
jgi:hypothetical protein